MALFNWFNNKSTSSKKAQARIGAPQVKHAHSAPSATTIPSAPHSGPAADPTNRSEQRKAKRHARREQLYSAIRQAMTRAGVLSASFKFKVLSLDQRGDQFLVMMDVHPTLGLQEEKLAESESLIAQTAKIQFGISVTSVYWRVDRKPESIELRHSGGESAPAPLASSPVPLTSIPAPLPSAVPVASVKKAGGSRYEPIEDEEMSAFKRALAASAAQTPAVVDSSGKSRSGLRSYTLITGFEDTEMPESAAVPALSATQYGDLN